MNLIRKLLDRSIECFACLMLATMLFVSSWQIVSRYLLSNPITFSEEFLRYALIWLALIGLAYANGKSDHISLELTPQLSPAGQRHLAGFGQLMLMLFALAVMIGGGSRAVALAADQVSPVLGISMAWVYLALPVSGVLCVIYSVLNLLGVHEESAELAPSLLELQGENHAA